MSSVSQLAAAALKTYLEGTTTAAVLAHNNALRPELVSKPGPFTFTNADGTGLLFSWLAPEEISDWQYDSLESSPIFWISAGTFTAAYLAASYSENPITSPYAVLDATTDGRLRVRWNSAGATLGPLRLLNRQQEGFEGVTLGNSIFGWDAGGEIAPCVELVAPTMRSICDGFPAVAPDMQAGMWLIIGDREAVPVDGSSLRRDVWEVRLPLHVMLPVRADAHHRSREAISGAVGTLEGLLLSTSGRYLGRQSNGDVIGVEVLSERIEAQPIVLEEVPHAYFDVATIDLLIRIHQRH